MIKNINIGKEIVVKAKNKVGIMADIAKLLADHGINVEGVAGYVQGDEASLMMVTSDNLRASDAIKKKGYNVSEKEIIAVDLENKPGALKVLTAKLASVGIDMKYVYGTTCSEGCPARIILSTTDNEKAVVEAMKK